ncbi:MAG: class II fumarate hydratase [Desulfobacterales bacterium]
MSYRTEKDSLGEVKIPGRAYYGAQTKRAADNFSISGIRMPGPLIAALASIKRFAAEVNRDLGLLAPDSAGPIARAAREVHAGKMNSQFIVDVFQTGSGTSTNMNMNEVVATRANEIITGLRRTKSPVHPNDHVNMGQSSNDVIPSALHISAVLEIRNRLLPALDLLKSRFLEKADEFAIVQKIGRTHLQDALPVGLGRVFMGYARQVELGKDRLSGPLDRLSELALGGTAVGTGVNTHPEFARRVIEKISGETGWRFFEAADHFEAQSARDAAAEVAGVLNTTAAGLIKIANDIRLAASGPRCGIGELILPELQPGSSIMPGKINPVIPEAVIQVGYQVIGNTSAITLGVQGGYFELNAAVPLIAHNLLQSIAIMAGAAGAFAEKCVAGLRADADACKAELEKSLALATYLVPRIGYDRAAEIAQKAHRTGKTIRETAAAEPDLSPEVVNECLDKEIGN